MSSEPPFGNKNHDFVGLLARHERAIRGFVRGLLPRSEDVDDVMQEVFVIAWKKFEDLNDLEDFPKWVCGIAKYQVLNFRRRMARDKLVLSEDVVAMLADEGIEENPKRAKQLKALEDCIEQLPAERKKMIRQVYQPQISVISIAKQLGKTENSVYQMLWRIRQSLANCVQAKVSQESA